MTQLVISLVLMLIASAFCSLAEAAFYSVPTSAVEHLKASGSRMGRYLDAIKKDMERYIASLLVLNTVANTLGVFFASSAGLELFKDFPGFVLPAVLTILVLLFGEIVPKTIGVNKARLLAPLLAAPFFWLTRILTVTGVLWPILRITRRMTQNKQEGDFRREDLTSLTDIGVREGVIDNHQASAIKNILALKSTTVRMVMTPRQVVFTLPARATIRECIDSTGHWDYSRIPVFGDKKDTWLGMVLRRDAYNLVAEGKADTVVKTLMRPLPLVPDSLGLDKMLAQFLRQRSHMAGVVDEYGATTGIVTLEDVLEGILGREIVDEFDQSVDMQEDARRRSIALAAIHLRED